MRLLALFLIIAAAPLLQADILHLRDGSRHYGELVEQTDQEVVFRICLDRDGSTLVQRFPAALVARIERTGTRDAPPPAVSRDSAPQTETAPGADDFEQMLREARELLADGDRQAALRALQRIALEAPQETLDALRSANEGVRLDELLARTRIEEALSADGTAFRITFATDLERPALGRLLSRYGEYLLRQRYDGRSVRAWSQAREEYTALGADAPSLVRDAARAAAVCSVRLRFDPVPNGKRELRRDLYRLREDLSRLAAHVLEMRGYTALPNPPLVDPVKRFREAVQGRETAAESPAGAADTGAPKTDRTPDTDDSMGAFAHQH